MRSKKIFTTSFFLVFTLSFSLSLLQADEKKPPASQTEQKPADQKNSTSKNTPAVEEPTSIQSPSIPPHAITESYENSFVKMLLTLLGLVVLIFLTVWMLRKLGSGKLRGMHLARSIKIIERRPLSAKSILYLIEVGGKQILIAESQLEVRPITSLDPMDPSHEQD